MQAFAFAFAKVGTRWQVSALGTLRIHDVALRLNYAVAFIVGGDTLVYHLGISRHNRTRLRQSSLLNRL